jgi:prepilin-type N-terminal cleavage/methylation domain-containing protein/prepilin-type processing-associated H-X9-DG protein
MIYIHELESVLSSIFLAAGSFSLSLPIHDQYHACEPTKSMARNSQLARAFTLIEVIVVLAIIVIMMAMVYPAYTTISERAKATKDLSNLRQIGLGTQTYLNDNDGVLFTAGGIWMNQLHPKYLAAWRIFQSPFDKRASSEVDASAPISYGLNGNTKGGASSIAGLSANKIANPSVFILFAPAQNSNASLVQFSGGTGAAVTVYKNVSVPGGTAQGGTHSSRKQINALFADLHAETMPWSKFILDNDLNDPSAALRWDPYPGYP